MNSNWILNIIALLFAALILYTFVNSTDNYKANSPISNTTGGITSGGSLTTGGGDSGGRTTFGTGK